MKGLGKEWRTIYNNMQSSQNELAAGLMTNARHFDGAEFENNIKSIIITGGVISAP